MAGMVDLVDKRNGVVLVGDPEPALHVDDWVILSDSVVPVRSPGSKFPGGGDMYTQSAPLVVR